MRGKTGEKGGSALTCWVCRVFRVHAHLVTAVFLFCSYFVSIRNLRVPRETFRPNDDLTRVFD